MQVSEQMNEIFELEEKLKELKEKQRQEALDHIKKLITSFGFTTASLFDGKRDKFRNGATDICRKILINNPGISSKEFKRMAVDQGVHRGTAGCQYTRLLKQMQTS